MSFGKITCVCATGDDIDNKVQFIYSSVCLFVWVDHKENG